MRTRKATPIRIYLKAFVSLFSGFFFEDCASCDFEKELASNEQLACSSPENKLKCRQEITHRTSQRLNLLRRRLGFSFILIISAIMVGVFCISLRNNNILTNILVPNYLFAVLSLVCFSWATLGRLGWEGQSWKGDTVFEDLDELIFKLLYWFGAFFGLLAIVL